MALEHESDSALAVAVRKVGSQSAFGRLLGKRQSTIRGWLLSDKLLPAENVRTVSDATGIPDYVLRPDIFSAPDPMSEPHSGGSPSAVQTPAAADGIHNPLRGLER
ncbi:YdaS family helix-turn-helix protein [Novosphingobium sp. KA1]|uniref:transcriptional regulator n=1 Tax=Novosphingobium sp. (strain KA1) TaxID=164608 RepID=UPI001A8D125A|nr:YdaS family helix-turn-helix protein [Novosphingobium sp. KA1]QSR16039.1 hypothetical protein CA833_02310 [Novosphingobium sp. KA1]